LQEQYNVKNNIMATMTLEYNASNKTARQILEGLIFSGIFKVKNDAKEAEKVEIKQNIRETKRMIEDIKQNGSAKYQNMDNFLANARYSAD
jgi:hypothetical protein